MAATYYTDLTIELLRLDCTFPDGWSIIGFVVHPDAHDWELLVRAVIHDEYADTALSGKLVEVMFSTGTLGSAPGNRPEVVGRRVIRPLSHNRYSVEDLLR